jgi:hypothetical protein
MSIDMREEALTLAALAEHVTISIALRGRPDLGGQAHRRRPGWHTTDGGRRHRSLRQGLRRHRGFGADVLA